MFRQLLLPCAWVGVAWGVALVAAVPSWGQDLTTQERLDRLERDLNMLQRQVYRAAPPSGGGDAGGAVNATIRMDRLEAQMRDLTGRVEEFVNQVDQVRQRIEQINSDIEMRAGPGVAAAAPPPIGNPGTPRPGRQYAAEPPPNNDDEDTAPHRAPEAGAKSPIVPGTAVPPPSAAPLGGSKPVFGTLTPPGSPIASGGLASAAPTGYPVAGGSLTSGSAAEQYNHAFGLLKQANYVAAEAALKAFVEQHPSDAMAGNAQYWLGETYYTRSRYLEAASAFAEGYKRYPKSAKAADDLLKLGMSLGRANQKQNACLALAQLDHDFPNPGAAIKEHAGAEKKRLGC